MRPSQKLGIDCRNSEPRRLRWSGRAVAVGGRDDAERNRRARVDSTRAAAASSTVAGQKCSSTMRHRRALLADGQPEVAARAPTAKKSSVLHEQRAVQAERVAGCGDLLLRRAGRRGSAAGSPVRRTRKKTTVTTPQTTKRAWRSRRSRKARIALVTLQRARRGSPCSAPGGGEPEHAHGVGVDLDLLVERHHRRPLAHLRWRSASAASRFLGSTSRRVAL